MVRGRLTLLLSATLVALGCGTDVNEQSGLRLDAGPPPVGIALPASATSPTSEPLAVSNEPAFLTDHAAAIAQAQAEGKPLLLFFGAQWCLHSKRLAGEMATDAKVAKLASQFVCVRVDVDAQAKLCEEYRVRAYPTLIIAAPGGVVLQRLTGLQSAADVAQELSAALTAVAERLHAPTQTLQR